MKFRIPTALVVGAAVAGVALSGCSTQSSNGPSSNGTDASKLVSQSADAMKALTGAHIVITADGKVPNVKFTKLDADVAGKPAVAATGEATLQMGGGQTQNAKLIYVDNHLYSDIAEPGKFVDYGKGDSIYNLSVIFDPAQGLANALTKIKDAKEAGSETINGTATTKVTGTISSNDAAQLAGSRKAPEKSTDVPITVWIGKDKPNNLVQAQVESPFAQDAKLTMTLSDFGKTVSVEKPQLTTPTDPEPGN
jgi:lipoprotein LprA